MTTSPTDPDDLTGDGQALGLLLTDLADDPDAPPTSVSALSVIAAAKAAAHGDAPDVPDVPDVPDAPGPGDSGDGIVESPAATQLPAVRSAALPVAAQQADRTTTGELHVLAVRQDADRRTRRRRNGLIGGLIAACAVGVAAIVVPLTVSNSGSNTSAAPDAAARASAETAAANAGGTAAGGTVAAGTGAPAAEAEQDIGAEANPTGGAGTATVDPSNPDANRPPPGEGALTEVLPVPEGVAPTDTGTGGGVAVSCWPALSAAAAAALVGSLPDGAFGPPGLLGLGCPADPVAGASLAGTAPDTQLVVRVIRAEPGACAQSASETGARCVARGGDQYVTNDSGNLSVYAYGNGYEVEVGGRPATGIAPIPSGLSADQLSVAAAAVLGTLG